MPLSYEYCPLEGPKWIRIIHLLPSLSLSEPLECHILHLDRERLQFSTDEYSNHYSAVSYVWGPCPVFSENLIVDGNTNRSSIIKITPSVDTMLRRFRSQVKPLNLWIDAISLEQSNKAEKEQQVPLMGEIYRQSSKVRVWMGNENQDVALAFAFFRTLALVPEMDVLRLKLKELLERVFVSQSTTCINQFLQRPWFSRRWTLQELALSRFAVIYCYDQKIHWTVLSQALSILKEHFGEDISSEVLSLNSEAIYALGISKLLNDTPPPLLDALRIFHRSDCSDPRDKLFAIASFCGIDVYANADVGYGSRSLRPASRPERAEFNEIFNYTDSFASTFTRFAGLCIANGYLDTIIQHTLEFGSLGAQDPSAPSWCPNWTNERRIAPDEYISDWSRALRRLPHWKWESTKWLAFRNLPHINQQCGLISRNQDFGAVLWKLSEDGRRLFMRQSATRVVGCTGPWPASFTWSDITNAILPILPKAIKDPFSFISESLITLLEFGDTSDELENHTWKTRSLSNYLSRIHGQEEILTDDNNAKAVVKYIEGDLLRATLQLMGCQSLFSTPVLRWQSQVEGYRDVTYSTCLVMGLCNQKVNTADIVLIPHSTVTEESRLSWAPRTAVPAPLLTTISATTTEYQMSSPKNEKLPPGTTDERGRRPPQSATENNSILMHHQKNKQYPSTQPAHETLYPSRNEVRQMRELLTIFQTGQNQRRGLVKLGSGGLPPEGWDIQKYDDSGDLVDYDEEPEYWESDHGDNAEDWEDCEAESDGPGQNWDWKNNRALVCRFSGQVIITVQDLDSKQAWQVHKRAEDTMLDIVLV